MDTQGSFATTGETESTAKVWRKTSWLDDLFGFHLCGTFVARSSISIWARRSRSEKYDDHDSNQCPARIFIFLFIFVVIFADTSNSLVLVVVVIVLLDYCDGNYDSSD